ncbi:dienelactone hydrolase family protein [Massilia sp. YIM B02443]|uniref:dienelactone hydrolase family protein n=1 Tax=Massilia sp. YIM B02443 TaxID=3050127 RepID=UPI0025B6D7D3|nr:CocE/NonD family hydrolase [Massilia sp. YIM B02443]MDN4036378.1 CocE/NonD family hydrolase [Massilia sp. YIM B02443]
MSIRTLISTSIAVLAMLPAMSHAQSELQAQPQVEPAALPLAAASAGALRALDYHMNERIVQVPAGENGEALLETTVFRPDGAGPFPLIVINHGKDPGRPSLQQRDRFYHMATAFVKRGYAVMVPMRQGFSRSGGSYREHGCDMTANGYTQAEDVRATLAFARQQPWVDADHIVVAGQSYGGLATIALGTQDLPGVRGLINFAGGLRDDSDRCAWRSQLVSAFAEYGSKAKLPSLWMYGQNDSLFGPELAQRMHDAYAQAGGRGRLVEFAAFKRDSHGMLASRDGEKVWLGDTEQFLKEIGMPTRVVFDVAPMPSPARTGFARVDDVAAVPFLSENGRRAYSDYLTKMTPRAFAVSPSGAWTWAEEGEDPDGRALATCSAKSKEPCRLYSVDDYVVWNDERLDQAEKASATAALTPAPAPTASAAVASTAPTTSVGSTTVR